MSVRNFLSLLVLSCFFACTSPEQRATGQTDTTTVEQSEAVGTDTVTNVNGRSGDNGTGTDTANAVEERAIRQSGQ